MTRALAPCLSGLITAGARVSNRKRFPPLHHAVTRLFQTRVFQTANRGVRNLLKIKMLRFS